MIEQWKKAQQEERNQHTHTMESGILHYGEVYRQYFIHLGIDPKQYNKRIIEIGCADFPALVFCKHFRWGVVIEPMPSDILRKLVKENIETMQLVQATAEEYELPPVDEVWLFNVLQHTISPDVIIEKSKAAASVVRFFEPINMPVDKCHIHTFTLDYFREHFGDAVKHYVAEEGVKNFHTQECAYGVWRHKA